MCIATAASAMQHEESPVRAPAKTRRPPPPAGTAAPARRRRRRPGSAVPQPAPPPQPAHPMAWIMCLVVISTGWACAAGRPGLVVQHPIPLGSYLLGGGLPCSHDMSRHCSCPAANVAGLQTDGLSSLCRSLCTWLAPISSLAAGEAATKPFSAAAAAARPASGAASWASSACRRRGLHRHSHHATSLCSHRCTAKEVQSLCNANS
jgi:hypothetical protein